MNRGEVVCWGDGVVPDRRDQGVYPFDLHAHAIDPVVIEGLPPVVQLGAGRRHFCARTDHGEVLCWGRSQDETLGRQTLREWDFRPLPVPGVTGATDLAVGAMSCAVIGESDVKCWGDFYVSPDEMGPASAGGVFSMPNAVSLRGLTSTGFEICGVTVGGSGRCFSRPPSDAPDEAAPRIVAEDVALFVQGHTQRGACFVDSAGGVSCEGEPVAWPGLDRVRAAQAGDDFMCALHGDDTVRCQGYGKLGGAGPPAASEEERRALRLPPVEQLAVGASHGCVLTQNQHVLCWGSNLHGQLGDGNSGVAEPRRSREQGVLEVTAGRRTCVRTALGFACTRFADCGEGGWEPVDAAPGLTGLVQGDEECGLFGSELRCGRPDFWRTVKLTTPTREAASYTGGRCVLGDDGKVVCVNAWDWKPVAVPGPEVRSLARGGVSPDGYCGIDATGHAVCVRDGVTKRHEELGRVKQLVASGNGLCAITAADHVVCSDGGEAKRVPWVDTATRIASLFEYLCAISDKGALACSGTPPFTDQTVRPAEHEGTPFDLPAAAIDVVAGEAHMCALLANGSLYCWGENEDGRLGEGALTCRTTPVDVTKRVLSAFGAAP